jgi:hypothetical protein
VQASTDLGVVVKRKIPVGHFASSQSAELSRLTDTMETLERIDRWMDRRLFSDAFRCYLAWNFMRCSYVVNLNRIVLETAEVCYHPIILLEGLRTG